MINLSVLERLHKVLVKPVLPDPPPMVVPRKYTKVSENISETVTHIVG